MKNDDNRWIQDCFAACKKFVKRAGMTRTTVPSEERTGTSVDEGHSVTITHEVPIS